MANPMTTAVWADLQVVNGVVRVVDGGRAGDGDLVVIGVEGELTHLCSVPMWAPSAEDSWLVWVAANNPSAVELWRSQPDDARRPTRSPTASPHFSHEAMTHDMAR